MLDKFEITRDDEGSFTVKSKIIGNIATIEQVISKVSKETLLWTILNDLYEEGYVATKGLNS